ncbi:unnamed protein product [Arctogadus glacialis]
MDTFTIRSALIEATCWNPAALTHWLSPRQDRDRRQDSPGTDGSTALGQTAGQPWDRLQDRDRRQDSPGTDGRTALGQGCPSGLGCFKARGPAPNEVRAPARSGPQRGPAPNEVRPPPRAPKVQRIRSLKSGPLSEVWPLRSGPPRAPEVRPQRSYLEPP